MPEDYIKKVEIKPDEYVVGFFGNVGEALDGFGIYKLKTPVIRRATIL